MSSQHPVPLAVGELLRKHEAGELTMATGPRYMTSAEQSLVLDTLGGLVEQLKALRQENEELREGRRDVQTEEYRELWQEAEGQQ